MIKSSEKISTNQSLTKTCFFVLSLLSFTSILYSQSLDSLIAKSGSYLNVLSSGDSLVYYQCHVEEASVNLSTASGQIISGKPQKYSITEKFVVFKNAARYQIRYYTSSYTDLPNRRFSGLKIREREYWNFKFQKEKALTETEVRALLALERKGREAVEYDFIISRNNRNQIIIKHHKDFKQLVIEGTYVISKLFSL